MIRILSYPPRHDYVDRLHGDVSLIVHRDEPWPQLPHYYDPRWLGERADDWDLAHLHFTWEQYPPGTLEDVLAVHREAGKPIVWTAHDLRNPHTPGAAVDDPYLAILASHADAVLTLTPGAATEIERRFDRRAFVVPHGPVLDPERAAGWRERRSGGRDGSLHVLLHLRGVRANVDWRSPLAVVDALLGEGIAVRLTVLIARDADQRADVETAATACAGVTVLPHGRLSLDELCARLTLADVLLLPYTWGTHSGMVELAADLGLRSIVGDVGYIREQVPCATVAVSDGYLVGGDLAAALRAAVDAAPEPLPLGDRRETLRRFRDEHARVYGRLHSG